MRCALAGRGRDISLRISLLRNKSKCQDSILVHVWPLASQIIHFLEETLLFWSVFDTRGWTSFPNPRLTVSWSMVVVNFSLLLVWEVKSCLTLPLVLSLRPVAWELELVLPGRSDQTIGTELKTSTCRLLSSNRLTHSHKLVLIHRFHRRQKTRSY